MICIAYLDDYHFLAPSQTRCNNKVRVLLEICGKLKVPTSLEKMEWASEVITFLGTNLHGTHSVLSIPHEKRIKPTNWIKFILTLNSKMIARFGFPSWILHL